MSEKRSGIVKNPFDLPTYQVIKKGGTDFENSPQSSFDQRIEFTYTKYLPYSPRLPHMLLFPHTYAVYEVILQV